MRLRLCPPTRPARSNEGLPATPPKVPTLWEEWARQGELEIKVLVRPPVRAVYLVDHQWDNRIQNNAFYFLLDGDPNRLVIVTREPITPGSAAEDAAYQEIRHLFTQEIIPDTTPEVINPRERMDVQQRARLSPEDILAASLANYLQAFDLGPELRGRTLKLILAVADGDQSVLRQDGIPPDIRARIYDAPHRVKESLLWRFSAIFLVNPTIVLTMAGLAPEHKRDAYDSAAALVMSASAHGPAAGRQSR
jgi:hypothetical protein